MAKSISHENYETVDDFGWHNRRSKSDVGIARKERFLVKKDNHRRKTLESSNTAVDNAQGETSWVFSRPKLRFMAAPGAMNKRKKQMTLESLLKKK